MAISEPRLDALERQLQSAGVDIFLLPMADEFQGEYTPEAAKRLPHLTGFTGSAGVGVFRAAPSETLRHALLVDGRYILQAPQQVSARIAVINSGETSLTEFLAAQAPGLRIGFSPWLVTQQQLTSWQTALADSGARFVALPNNPVDMIWQDRPPMPQGEVALHPQELAGKSYMEKRQALLDMMATKRADALLLTLPDGINWLLNLRGNDIPFNPLLLSYFLLRRDGSGTLMLAERSLSADLDNFLREQSIDTIPLPFMTPLPDTLLPATSRVLIDPATSAAAWWEIAATQGWELLETPDPTLLPKACKNPSELAGIRAAHTVDGLALSRFLAWLDGQTASYRYPTELEVMAQLESFRARDPNYRGASFATIAGSGPNGAIVHYHAEAGSNRRLAPGELFLLDSGGQYPGGTTDVTRTIAIGVPSEAMRRHFTLVLKGHIALASARFPVGTSGSQLDVLARQFLWAEGLDYDHGTGHGVGAYLCVHEGPQRISKRGSAVALQPGMVLSNEPGYYQAGAYGIRIENLVAVVADAPGMLAFETLTLAPLDTRLIVVDMLTSAEHNWLNNYHRQVYTAHAAHLTPPELRWLTHATRAI